MLFIDFYNSVLNTSFTKDDLPFPLEKIHVKKGTCITKYGQVEDSLYFMNKGIVEMTIKSYMTEKIIDFFLKLNYSVDILLFWANFQRMFK